MRIGYNKKNRVIIMFLISFIFVLLMYQVKASGTAINVTDEGVYDHLSSASNETKLYFNFDVNDSTAYDYSEYNNDGTINNSLFTSNGLVGGARIFNGVNSSIIVPYNQNINFTKPFSISIWFNASDLVSGKTLLAEYNGTTMNFRIFQNTNTKIRFEIEDSAGSSKFVTSTTSFVVGQNYNIIANANATRLELYVNGVLEDFFNTATGIRQFDIPLTIGSDSSPTTTTDLWNGTIDSVRISNITINSSQALQIANVTFPYFKAQGTDTYDNNNVSSSLSHNRINITLNCQTYNGTYLGFQAGWVNGSGYTYGAIQNFTNCNISNYSISGLASNLSFRYYLYSNQYNSYSPLILNKNIVSYSEGDILNPNGTLLQPVDNLYTNITAVNFTINATDNNALSNITLYIYNGSILVSQQTQVVSGSSGIFGILYNFLTDGIFKWFYQIVDTAGNIFTTGNRTIIVDTIYPQLAISFPTASNYSYQISNITHVVNETNLANCTFSNGTITNTITCNQTYYFNSSEGINTWSITATDLAGQSYVKPVIFLVDTINPQITYGANTPSNLATILSHSFLVNVSVTEANFNSINFVLYNETASYSDLTFNTPIYSVLYTNLIDGNYTFNVTITDSVGRNNYTSSRNVRIYNPQVFLNITSPPTKTFNFNDTINGVIMYNSLETLNYSYSVWGYPNGSTKTLQAKSNLQGTDLLDNSTHWTIDNQTMSPNQTCIANVSFGEGHIFISGDGTPVQNPSCALKDGAVAHDFEIQIDYNISLLETDSAMYWLMTDENLLTNLNKYFFISMGNWAGYPRGLDVFIDDGNISGYVVNSLPNNQTEGKFKVTRVGNNFSFYNYNGTEFEFLHSGVYEGIEPVLNQYLILTSSATNYGSAYVMFDNLNISIDSDVNLYNQFNDTWQGGFYNVTFYASNILGFTNYSNTSAFFIGDLNYPPTTPILNHPEPLDNYSRNIIIQWNEVVDTNNDSLNFQIDLLNADASLNQTIITGYGDIGTTTYNWSIPNLSDGAYSLNLSVYENETLEEYRRTYTLIPYYFFIDQTPPNLTIISPQADNYSTNSLLINISSDGYNVWFYNGTENVTYNNSVYETFSQGYFNFTAYATEKIGNEELYGNEISQTNEIFIDSINPIITFVSPTPANASSIGVNNFKIKVSVNDISFRNTTIRLYNSSGLASETTSTNNPYQVQYINLTNGNYKYNVTSCDMFRCIDSATRNVNVNLGLSNNLSITLTIEQYPYLDVNTTYSLRAGFFADSTTITDAIVNFSVFNSDGTNESYIMPYNSSIDLYQLHILFNQTGDYPFTINANSSSFGAKTESGTFLVRNPFTLTIRLYDQKSSDNIVNNYAYVTAEYVGNKKVSDVIEPFMQPLIFNAQRQKTFHSQYINGEAQLKLFEPQTDYIFRYFDGVVKFSGTYSEPNITKSYGTNVYLGTQRVNGTDSLYQFVLTEKDQNPWRWLGNWLLVIGLILVLVVSAILFFTFPQVPWLALIFGFLFSGILMLLRFIAWWVYGW